MGLAVPRVVQEGVGGGLVLDDGSGVALTAFAVYLLVLVAIGVWSARFSSQGVGEFFLGGRRMNRFVVALSAVVSGRSAWLLLGVTGMAFVQGVSAVWAVVGYTVVEGLMFFTLAGRLRRFSEVHDAVTLPDVFAARFGDDDGRLRAVLAVILIAFMVSYVSAQFAAGGKAIGASFGLGTGTGVVLTALIVLAYTGVGGFLAVSLTDTLQAVFMLVGLFVVPVLAVSDAGGWDAVRASLSGDVGFLDPTALGFGAFLGLVGIGLGSPGNPHIVVRYMAIDDARQLRFAGVVGTLWNVLMGASAVAIGVVGRVYFAEAALLPGADTENLYPVLAQTHLPPLLFGVVVASIFAAIMSTADSQLLVAASAVVRDLVQGRGAVLTDAQLVRLSRATVVLLVLAALGLGVLAEQLVFWLVLFAWAGLGAALGPPLILALYWRGTTRPGVFAGLVTGAGATVIWYLTPALKSRLYELIPAFLLSVVATVVVSRVTRPPPEVEADFRAMEE